MAARLSGPTIRIRPSDIVEGRAFVTLSGDAKIALCHRAGAPWSDKDPNAKLHDLQREVLIRLEREKIVHGASRLGKSVLGGCEALCEAMLPFTSTAVVASRYDHVGHEFQYVYRGLKRLFRQHAAAFTRLVFKSTMTYHVFDVDTVWGSRVRGFSTEADEGASLLGQEFSRVVLGEGSHIAPDILDRKIMRAIDGALMKRGDGITRHTGHLSIFTTPSGFEGCSAAEWERIHKQTQRRPHHMHYGRVPFAESVWIREANILENPAYDRKVYEARKKLLDPLAFAEQWQGKMTFRTGAIYPEYSEACHHNVSGPDVLRRMRFAVGIDTGAYFAASLWGIIGYPDDYHIYQLCEVYEEQQTIDVCCGNLREEIMATLGPAFPGQPWEVIAERIDMWPIDPASQHKLEIMDKLGITVIHPAKADGGATVGSKARGEAAFPLLSTIEFVRELFKQGRLHIGEHCDFTQDQLRKYVWATRKAGGLRKHAGRAPVVKEPNKVYDHLVDAMRMAVVPLAQLGPYDEEEVPVLTLEEAEKQNNHRILFGPLKRALEQGRRRERQLGLLD